VIYRPYTYNASVPGNSTGGTKPSPYPQTSLMSAVLNRLPFSLQIIDSLINNNPKFYDFKHQSSNREEMLQKQSVFIGDDFGGKDNYGTGTPGSFSFNKDYQAFIYAQIDKDKSNRLMDYRKMAAYAELADCLDEICDECIVLNEKQEVVKIDIQNTYSKTVQDSIIKEFFSFIQIFDLENKGWELFRQLLVEGEVFFENIIHQEKKRLGIIGVMSIPSELINPVYHNVQNELLKGFLLRKPIVGPTESINREDQEELLFLQKAQVSYMHSNLWNEFRTIRIPFIENSKRAYRQLTLIEDAVVVYRLVRAPERLQFKVYTGNMPPPRAEAYIKGLMMKFWSKKTYNGTEKQVANVYDPQSMLDAYWFPVDASGKGTEVNTLPSSNPLNEIKDLDYFLTKLYKTLKVPISRFLTAGDVFKDGAEITRDELRFARFIIRLQAQVASGIKQTFITHLKLKGLWDEYNLKEQSFRIKFNEPTSFMTMRNQQLLALKFENYNSATQGEFISKSYAQKYYLDMSAEEMKENREWMRRDAALTWELEQIKASGPNFRELAASQQEITDSTTGGASDMMSGGGGASPEIPEFGKEAPGEGEVPDFGGQTNEPTQTSSTDTASSSAGPEVETPSTAQAVSPATSPVS